MLIFDDKTVQGEEEVQLEFTSYFANIGKQLLPRQTLQLLVAVSEPILDPHV